MDDDFLADERDNIATGKGTANRRLFFHLEAIDRVYYYIYGLGAINMWLVVSILLLYIQEYIDSPAVFSYDAAIQTSFVCFLPMLCFLLYIYTILSSRSRFDFNEVAIASPEIGQGKVNQALMDSYGKNGKLLAATARNPDGSSICINSQCCPNDPSFASSNTTNPYWDPDQNKCILPLQSATQ